MRHVLISHIPIFSSRSNSTFVTELHSEKLTTMFSKLTNYKLLKYTRDNIKNLRKASTTSSFEEIRIPVPWGHVAGKWWGPKDKRPIITIHGWQDCCESFDLLIPTLPKEHSFLALDLPGHGLSSKIPAGNFCYRLADVMLIRRLQAYFNLEKIALMGHSLGAISCYTFAGLFPQSVDFLICLDGLIPIWRKRCLDHASSSIDRFLKFDAQVVASQSSQNPKATNNEPDSESNSEPVCYTYEELHNIFYEAMKDMVDKDKCEYLLKRNIKEGQPGRFYFYRDPRIKAGHLLNWSREDLEEHARRITCPVLGTYTGVSLAILLPEVINPIRKVLIENNNRTEFYNIQEKHHGHLNRPELYTGIVGSFIDKYNKENREVPRL